MNHEMVESRIFVHVMSGRGHIGGGAPIERPQAPRPVIARWEVDAYVNMETDRLRQDAERCDFTVDQTPGSREALAGLRGDLMEGIHQRYIVTEE